MACLRSGSPYAIRVTASDFVIATIGSMTEGSTLGSMDEPARMQELPEGGSWAFWDKLTQEHSDCGRPTNFNTHIKESKWLSFTSTLHSSTFFDSIRDLTGNAPGEGGLISFPESNWLASIVLPHQPHFIGQPKEVLVFWGYGLFVDQPGNFVKKPMGECTGREIMTEIMGHLRLTAQTDEVLGSCICVPCMMPFITSQFLPRSEGDRPAVVPPRSKNLALIGQFCEMEDDVVFTVEYSIRSAQTAVYSLLGVDRKPHPVYKGNHDPRVLLKAFLALHGKHD